MTKNILLAITLAGLAVVDSTWATAPPPPIVGGGCEAAQHTLLLGNHTVLRNVRWRIGGAGPDHSDLVGCGTAIPHREATGHLWFFASDNIELTCKALDGTALTGAYWVFCGGLTDVEWWMDAINNANPHIQRQYYNPPGKMASFGDVGALPKGNNSAPSFDAGYCDSYFEIPVNQRGFLTVVVADQNNDPLVARVRILQGEPGVSFEQASVLVPDGQGEVLFPFTGSIAGTYLIGVEVDDHQTLIPPLCTVKLRVKQ